MMKLISTLLIVLSILFLAQSAHADGTKPINLALVTPVQIFDDSTAIHGFRFNLLYGRNAEMMGFDLGLVNHITGATVGYQLGVVSISDEFKGWQSNWAVNLTKSLTGLQSGTVNYAQSATGVQFGLVNISSDLKGLQIGLINIAANGFLPVFVLFNFAVD